MAKASVGGEATARSTRSVRRGTEDGTKGIDQQSKLGTLYGPKGLLAPPRPRRLRSSFHLPSHLQEMSNITTRANQPIPATGLSPVRPSSIMGCKPRRKEVGPRRSSTSPILCEKPIHLVGLRR